jgi:hypothetical protein
LRAILNSRILGRSMPHRAFINFENLHAPLLPRRRFYHRVVRTTLTSLGLVMIALGIGMVGYRVTEHMGWIDAFANASMILSGMGPLGTLQTKAGKLFAGCYALFSGLAFITLVGVVLAPFIHRAFHRFHLADDKTAKNG